MSNFQLVWRYICLKLARTSLDFCLWGWMKSEVYKEKVNTGDDLVARIMTSAALIKQERQDDLRSATRTVAKRVEKCIEVDGGTFEHLLWTVAIYWDYLHKQQMQSKSHLSFLRTFCKAFYAWHSNNYISTPTKNWTLVYMNLFTRNSPYYHLLKYLLFFLKQPVYWNIWWTMYEKWIRNSS